MLLRTCWQFSMEALGVPFHPRHLVHTVHPCSYKSLITLVFSYLHRKSNETATQRREPLEGQPLGFALGGLDPGMMQFGAGGTSASR